ERPEHAFRGTRSIRGPPGEHERARLQRAEACLVDGAEVATTNLAAVLEEPQRLAAVPRLDLGRREEVVGERDERLVLGALEDLERTSRVPARQARLV